MSVENYNDLFNITWHTDSSGNKVSIKRTNEEHIVVGNIILLNEIPDESYRVRITDMYELSKGQEITNSNEYIVDYLTGRITFHSSLDGQTITVDRYYGRGLIKGYAIRTVLLDANNNWDSDNLEDLAAEIKQYIDQNRSEVNIAIKHLQDVRIYEGATEPTDTRFWYDPNDNSVVIRK
jgi:hypothetical protein